MAVCVAGVLLAGLLCLLPLVAPAPADWLGGPVDLRRLAPLALLHLCLESLADGMPTPCSRLWRRLAGRAPHPDQPGRRGGSSFFPVLFAGVLMLPPAAAALVAVPAALFGNAARPGPVRRLWNAAQLALAAFAGAVVFHLLGGPRLLLGSRFPAAALGALAAVLVFCLVNGVLVGIVRRLSGSGEPIGGPRALWACLVAALLHGAAGLMVAVLWQGPYGALAVLLALLPLSISAWVSAQTHREQAAHRATVQALVQAVEIKDAYTRGHSERVGRASVLIARQLGMAEDRIRTLHFAGTLHDVGKLAVATELLRRNGPLSEAERHAVEVHPVAGHELVRDLAFLGEARDGILHHHERLDGRGYPDGLAGSRIPEFARIISVADAFDSMTSTRSYRRGRPVDEAVAELGRCAGSQFDPVMVGALVSALDQHGWQVEPPPPGGWDGEVPDIPLGVPEPARRSRGRGAAVPTRGGSS
ncbi:HD-GYP domain-containing protein [Kitasatospora sp. NPDC048540]|uniref:HD-GYP domain-containing protein n=1 Tax=unclassified Kitasatospora TaxID=2633591 RepID=UPI00053ABF4E|nr:HD-GYP domain-containing protein [Kitasatospora sp. MBT63]